MMKKIREALEDNANYLFHQLPLSEPTYRRTEEALAELDQMQQRLESDIMDAYVEGYAKAKSIYINNVDTFTPCSEHWRKSKAKAAQATINTISKQLKGESSE